MTRADRAIGVALGVLLGLAIVIAFVFLGSGDTIDDPSVSGDEPEQHRENGRSPAKPQPAQP